MIFALLAVIAGLGGLIVYLTIRYDQRLTAWDVERGRYVAALLAQSKLGDGVASSVVRPRPQAGSIVPAEPKPIAEGM